MPHPASTDLLADIRARLYTAVLSDVLDELGFRRSGTVSLSGNNAGSPITQTEPMTAPARLPRPPMTAIDTSVSESSTRKYCCE